MIISCHQINKSFGSTDILKDISFHIEEKEKAAIVGVNGAGKTTLLRILTGALKPDSGEVLYGKDKKLGYLAQHQELPGEQTIYETMLEVRRDLIELEERIRLTEKEMKKTEGQKLEELLEKYTRMTHSFEIQDGYAFKSELTGVLKGLGFSEDDFQKQTGTLSGGQKTRLFLARLLYSKPDILLLDEPTNHLDLSSISWLETFLANYRGTVVIVAHDRYFLDKIVTKVIEIENTKGMVFSGNYSAFAEKKAALRESMLKAYLNQQQEIKHQKEVITKLKSFNREKSIKRAESREKMLDKIEVLDKPVPDSAEMSIHLTPQILSGSDVLEVEGLSKAFGDLQLFENLSFSIKRGEKAAIIGDNGTGKTTILKMINRLSEPDSGTITLGANVHIGYYDQEHSLLNREKTIFDELHDAYPKLTQTQIRNVLAAFLFTGDDVYKQIRDLSGGERGRVSLAKLMLSNANFLILDEPTNHLDILSKEILEKALNEYQGTLLYVSHDRYFINKTANRILDLKHNQLTNYYGNYDYYEEKVHELAPKAAETGSDKKEAASKNDWQQQKEAQARKRKLENDLKKTEQSIAEIEQRNQEIDELLAKEEVYTDVPRLLELNKEKELLEEQLETLYETWETLESAAGSEV